MISLHSAWQARGRESTNSTVCSGNHVTMFALACLLNGMPLIAVNASFIGLSV